MTPHNVTKTVFEKSQRLGVGSPGRYTKAPSKRPLTAGWMELNEPPSLSKAWCRCNYSAPRPSSTPGLIRGMYAAALAAKERVLELSGTSGALLLPPRCSGTEQCARHNCRDSACAGRVWISAVWDPFWAV